MAIIKNIINNKEASTTFELTLKPSEWAFPNVKWVKVGLVFDIGTKFPKIEVERNCQDISDSKYFVEGLKKFLESDEKEFDFYPTEPDYYFKIQRFVEGKFKKRESYEISVSLDLSGIVEGVYGTGELSLTLSSNIEQLKCFADEIEKEIVELEKHYNATILK